MKNGLIIDCYGTKYWYKEDLLHREDGPAIEYISGHKEWRFNGKIHREGGPAIEYFDGTKVWYKNGKCHREDGPSRYCDQYEEWWFNGEQLECSSNEEFLRLIKLKGFW